MIRERAILEHGPADGHKHSVRPTWALIVVPAMPNCAVFTSKWFERHNYHRTPRNSGAPEFRRIYTWVE
ncbi:hypothetical protein KA005_20770 [bacterium]|nr:hypothetical protein [bacterium]